MPATTGRGRPLFAFGGRLADTFGHRRTVTLGVIVFAAASGLCGLTPRGSIAGGWLVTFQAVQGAGGALLYLAALGIVVQTFPLALIASGIGLSVFGSHQLSVWGWANPATGGSSAMAAIPRFVRADLAQASQTVFLVMAGIMAAAALVALTGLRAGRQEEPSESGTVRGSQTPHEEAGARP